MKISEKRALVAKRQKAKERELARIKRKEAADNKKKKTALQDKSETLQIFPDARIYKTALTNKFKNRKIWQKPDPQEIKSIIPGVVLSLNVKKGDHVDAGQQVMIFEAMKMHNVVAAPFTGTVTKIMVKKGEKVPKGTPMLYIKSDEKIVEHQDDLLTAGDLGLIV